MLLGIALSYYLDSPTGPMIVLVGTGSFLFVFAYTQLMPSGKASSE